MPQIRGRHVGYGGHLGSSINGGRGHEPNARLTGTTRTLRTRTGTLRTGTLRTEALTLPAPTRTQPELTQHAMTERSVTRRSATGHALTQRTRTEPTLTQPTETLATEALATETRGRNTGHPGDLNARAAAAHAELWLLGPSAGAPRARETACLWAPSRRALTQTRLNAGTGTLLETLTRTPPTQRNRYSYATY